MLLLAILGGCIFAVVHNPGILSDVLEAVPFGGQILSVMYKFTSTGEFVLPDNALNWTLAEVLNSLLIAVMSSLMGAAVGRMFNYGSGLWRSFQYFLCDVIAIVVSCLMVEEICAMASGYIGLPVVVTQILLIVLFTFLDLVFFSPTGVRGISRLTAIVFLTDLLKSVLEMLLAIMIIVLIYMMVVGGFAVVTCVPILLCVLGIGMIFKMLAG